MSCGLRNLLSLHTVYPFLELMATTITKSTSVVYHWSARHLRRTGAIHDTCHEAGNKNDGNFPSSCVDFSAQNRILLPPKSESSYKQNYHSCYDTDTCQRYSGNEKSKFGVWILAPLQSEKLSNDHTEH